MMLPQTSCPTVWGPHMTLFRFNIGSGGRVPTLACTVSYCLRRVGGSGGSGRGLEHRHALIDWQCRAYGGAAMYVHARLCASFKAEPKLEMCVALRTCRRGATRERVSS